MRTPVIAPTVPDKQAVEYAKAQDHILVLMLLHPALREHLSVLVPEMFAEANAKELLGFLKMHPDFDGSKQSVAKLAEIAKAIQSPNDPSQSVQTFGDYARILLLQHEQLYQDLDETELAYEASRLTRTLVETYVKLQKQILAGQLAGAGEAETNQLLERVRHLDTLLHQVRGGQ